MRLIQSGCVQGAQVSVSRGLASVSDSAVYPTELHEEMNNALQRLAYESRNCSMLSFLAKVINLIKVKGITIS